jgi:hypothetical protein
MGHRKNEWINRAGYRKLGTRVHFPCEGRTILPGSTIRCILLRPDGKEKIRIEASYDVYLGTDWTPASEVSDEFEDYLDQVIIGRKLTMAAMDRQKGLELKMDTEPELRIVVRGDRPEARWDQWYYDQPDGWLGG